MVRAAGVELAGTGRANKSAFEIFFDRKLMAARTAKDRFFVELRFGPRFSLVAFSGRVTFKARVPATAAAKLYRDDVRHAVVMNAARLLIN